MTLQKENVGQTGKQPKIADEQWEIERKTEGVEKYDCSLHIYTKSESKRTITSRLITIIRGGIMLPTAVSLRTP
jgi:hypothetical protein